MEREPIEIEEEEFPLHNDLNRLMDLMDQLPVEDVDQEGRRISPQTMNVVPVADDDFEEDNDFDDPFFDGELDEEPHDAAPVRAAPVRKKTSRAEQKGLPKKPLAKKAPVIAVEEPPKVVVRDTTDDIITRDRLLAIATEVFGEERVDLQVNYSTNYNLYIHFPDFVISNSNDNTHRIRDLFVIFNISQSGTSFGVTLSGVRSTITLSENSVQYAHSHLPCGTTNGNPQSFCQGTSAFKAITTSLVVKPTEGQWELALLSLENYVKWESLEGGPHMKMSGITSNSSSQNVDYLAELKRWIEEIPLDTFDIFNGLQLNYSERLKEFYNKVSLIRGPRANNNSAERVRQAQEQWNRSNRMRITFKGKALKMTIIPDEGATEETFIDQSVINQYNSLLESYLATFNKRIDYEHLRYRNRGALGKIPTFQPADISYYKATAGKDRLVARARRKQGVVGRVNHLRKREDNRLG